MTICYDENSKQTKVILAPMLFGVLLEEDCLKECAHQEDIADDIRVGEWNELFKTIKEHCMAFAEEIRSAPGAIVEDHGFFISLVIGNESLSGFKTRISRIGQNFFCQTSRLDKIYHLFSAGTSFSRVVCINIAPALANSFRNDRKFLEGLLLNNDRYVKQMIYVILHREYLAFLDILALIDILYQSPFRDSAIGYMLFMINANDLSLELSPVGYNFLLERLVELRLYSHVLILDERYFAESSKYNEIIAGFTAENSCMQSTNSPHIVTYYRVSGKPDCVVQVYIEGIPVLLKKAIKLGWSVLHIQRMFLDILHMPNVCLYISGSILEEILGIIRKQKCCVIYLETLFTATSEYYMTLEILRELGCGILGRMFFSNDEISEIMAFVGNHHKMIEYTGEIGDCTRALFKTPLGADFFRQLEDLELAELLDRFREHLWIF